MMCYPLAMFVGKSKSGKDTAGKVICDEIGGQAIALADPIKRFFLKAGMTQEQLWGSEKETEIIRPDLDAEHCKFWLALALGGWKTPVELQRIDFAKWEAGLPDRTTPRYLMQTFGTECVRVFSPDLWIDSGLHAVAEILAGRKAYNREAGLFVREVPAPSIVVITDGRFRNEVLKVKQAGGWIGRLFREADTGLTAEAQAHASESEQDSIPLWWADCVIQNSGGLKEFERRIGQIVRYELAGRPA